VAVVYSGDCTNVTSANGCTATATYAGDANHTGSSDNKSLTITKAAALIGVTPYSVTYDGSAHTATGTATGVQAEALTGLDLSGTTHTAANSYPSDPWTFTDVTGNYSDANATVADAIGQASSTTVVTFEAGPYTYRGTAFTATANVTGAGGLSSPVAVVYSGDCTNVTSANGCTATATYAGDANHTGSSDNKSLTITQAPSTTMVTVTPGTQQYSDKVTFEATISPEQIGGVAPATGSVEFYVGTQYMGTAAWSVDGTQLKATLANKALVEVPANPSNGQLAPGTRTVTAKILNKNPNFSVTDPMTTLVITKENASVEYTGLEYWSTPNASTTTAQVTLRATILDMSDGAPGDIRNAKVNLVNRDNASTPFSGCANLVPAPLNPGDYTVGTVSCIVALAAGSGSDPSATYTVGTVVNNYYDQNAPAYDNQLITVTLAGTGFITGGGHIINSASAGQYAGTAGAKSNFGFNVKFNKNKTNLQGHVNLIVRRLVAGAWKTYQIKSNAINSMGVTNTTSTTGVANFLSKANLTDVTNPLAPVSLGGNLQLQMTLTDSGEPGTNDKIGFTLWDGNTLLFSSEWTGSTTLEKLLRGGNLQIR
jgi:hypothetical protein